MSDPFEMSMICHSGVDAGKFASWLDDGDYLYDIEGQVIIIPCASMEFGTELVKAATQHGWMSDVTAQAAVTQLNERLK